MFLCCDFQKAEAGTSARNDDSRRSPGDADVCGKTISLKALMGLLPFEGGKITVCGNDLSRMAERQRARLHLAALELVGGRIEYSSLDRSASNAQFKMGLIKSTSAGRCFWSRGPLSSHVVEKMKLMCKIFLFGGG